MPANSTGHGSNPQLPALAAFVALAICHRPDLLAVAKDVTDKHVGGRYTTNGQLCSAIAAACHKDEVHQQVCRFLLNQLVPLSTLRNWLTTLRMQPQPGGATTARGGQEPRGPD